MRRVLLMKFEIFLLPRVIYKCNEFMDRGLDSMQVYYVFRHSCSLTGWPTIWNKFDYRKDIKRRQNIGTLHYSKHLPIFYSFFLLTTQHLIEGFIFVEVNCIAFSNPHYGFGFPLFCTILKLKCIQ